MILSCFILYNKIQKQTLKHPNYRFLQVRDLATANIRGKIRQATHTYIYTLLECLSRFVEDTNLDHK